MDLQEIRIYSKDKKSHNTCNVILTFECVDYSCNDPAFYEKSPHAVLHRVQLEPTADSTFTIDCPLNDSEALTHFENLLSSNLGHVTVHTGEGA